ncbi:beta-propeller domain-containing protein [bacterium]|nr:beta-propeller domain-containing protein [bacterium]
MMTSRTGQSPTKAVLLTPWFMLLAALLTVAALSGGCSCDGDGDSDSDVTLETKGLVRCEDCDDVLSWARRVAKDQMRRTLENNYDDSVRYGGYVDDDVVYDDDEGSFDDDDDAADDDASDDDFAGDDDDDDGAPEEPTNGGDDDDAGDDDEDHSDTNTQEEDVDEADIVKTDGNLLYLLAGGEMLIFDPVPAGETHEISRTDVEGTPLEMFLYDNLVVVFSQMRPSDLPADVWPDAPRDSIHYPLTVITVFDTTDPMVPERLRTTYAEGSYLSSRRVGSGVRVVTMSYPRGPQLREWVDPWSEGYVNPDGSIDEEALKDAYDRLLAENLAAIDEMPLETWIPRYFEVAGDERRSGFMAECQDFFHPVDPLGRGVSTVMTIELTDPTAKQPDISLLADGQLIYSSTERLYIAGDAEIVHQWDAEAYTSLVHQFVYGGRGEQIAYTASGQIEGFVLNQFSMGEYDGYLRVAANTGWWGGEPESRVYVMHDDGNGRLETVGRIENIAPGEDLRSARFLGDKGYVITFEQTDPLFTMDLSDPENPRLAGELEIPGFSTYIHPFGPDHLLTIGVNGDEWSATGGVALQMFDISDIAHPTLADREIAAEGWDSTSAALYDHKAFLYYAPKELLAIPITDYGWDDYGDDDDVVFEDDEGEGEEMGMDDDDDDDDIAIDDDVVEPGDDDDQPPTPLEHLSGVKLYRVTPEEGFVPLGFVDHSDLLPENTDFWYEVVPFVKRSVVIGDYIYTISDAALVVTRLEGLDDVVTEDLPYEYPDYGYGDDDWADDDVAVEPVDEGVETFD